MQYDMKRITTALCLFLATMAGAQEVEKRWETGIYMLWYPIKAHLPVTDLHKAAQEWGDDVFIWEFLKYPRQQPETFNGSGLIFLGPPYQLRERLQAMEGVLGTTLGGRFEISAA